MADESEDAPRHARPHSAASIHAVADYEIILDCTNNKTSVDDLRIHLDPERYGRHMLDKESEAAIDEAWNRQKRMKPHLFNAAKFRFFDAKREGVYINLCLGLCDYKAFVGTNLGQEAAKLRVAGQAAGDPSRYLSNPLGVAAVVETRDHFIPVLRRSALVGEAAGMIDCPGGHPEPSECGLSLNHVVVVGAPKRIRARPAADANRSAPADLSKLAPLVQRQIGDSILQEIAAELNVQGDLLDAPILLGFVRNNTTAGRVCACFAVQYRGTIEEAQKRYERGGTEKDESTSMIAIPASQLLHTNTTEPSINLYGCKEVVSSAPGSTEEDDTPPVYTSKVKPPRHDNQGSNVDGVRTTIISTDDITPNAKASFELWRMWKQKKAAAAKKWTAGTE